MKIRFINLSFVYELKDFLPLPFASLFSTYHFRFIYKIKLLITSFINQYQNYTRTSMFYTGSGIIFTGSSIILILAYEILPIGESAFFYCKKIFNQPYAQQSFQLWLKDESLS